MDGQSHLLEKWKVANIMLDIPIKLLHPDAKVPTKAHFEDAGWDLYCVQDIRITSRVLKVKTGIAISIPRGYVGLIWDRSGLGSKGIKVHGGVIDSGYVGEIIVCLSLPAQPDEPNTYACVSMDTGTRIAQLLIQEIPLHCTWTPVDELPETDRGEGRFGSTGQ